MMKSIDRRRFLGTAAAAAGTLATGPMITSGFSKSSPNDTINLAVIGINGRGGGLAKSFAELPNTRVATLCDPDERLFPKHVKAIEDVTGKAPKTEYDLRSVYDDKDIDAVVIATPDHWHSLAGIWACQAGKDVYLEKPISHNVWEGRKVVEAARKYNRIVATGTQSRSNTGVLKAMDYLHSGAIGDVFMAKALCYKRRDSIGRKPNTPAPEGLHWDLWLGPAPLRPFSANLVHYNWHWFWDFGTTDMGNQGVHEMDKARWGLNKREYPKKIYGIGGHFAFDDDQETPNTQHTSYIYEDGTILQFEVRGLYTNYEDGINIGNLYYGTEGWMHLLRGSFNIYEGRETKPAIVYNSTEEAPDPNNLIGTGGGNHQANFLHCVRTRNQEDLSSDILEGHLSSSLCHLGNISYRLGRELEFDSHAERFVDDEIADSYLTRDYRHPYVVPENV